MAHDALAPGPLGNYPWFPRLPGGAPDYQRFVGPDARQAGDGRWVTTQRYRGDSILIDVTPRDQNGVPLTIPTLPA